MTIIGQVRVTAVSAFRFIAPLSFVVSFVVAFAQPGAAADPVRGALLYKECAGCHAPQRTLMGPPHCGVVGRKAASIDGFAYSDTLRAAGFVWDDKHLHEFLTFPIMYMPGTKMGFAGMFDENDRDDVIAFLKKERSPDSPACQPGADPAPPPGTNTGEIGADGNASAQLPAVKVQN
ncbi:MAG: c-type cytochrome [Rhodospirillaceae bacterium]|nr:c-type cytochrome [Rhodospirillaceae bacterium]